MCIKNKLFDKVYFIQILGHYFVENTTYIDI